MEEVLLKEQIEQMQTELRNLRVQVSAPVPQQTKDLSLLGLIPKRSGSDKAVSVKDFFDTVESTAGIGNWSDSDKIRITVLKLTDVAKAFYCSSRVLQNVNVTWDAFKATFMHRFRDVRPPQFHYVQLQSARQHRDESPQDFADRVRALAMKTVPRVDDPQLQRFHYDQADRMILSTFISGLIGNPGQQVRFRMPKSVEEAVQIAVTVYEAEKQERRNQAFFSNMSSDIRDRDFVKPSVGQGSIRDKRQVSTGTAVVDRQSSGKDIQCYNCGKFGHFARHCFRNKKFSDRKQDRGQNSRTNMQSSSQQPARTNSQKDEVRRSTHFQGNWN